MQGASVAKVCELSSKVWAKLNNIGIGNDVGDTLVRRSAMEILM